jgi:D-alanine-D-alanine ligase
MKMRKKVALIYGGEGLEHSISVMSAKCIQGMIDSKKYETVPVFIDKDGSWYIDGSKLCKTSDSQAKDKGTPTFPIILEGCSGLLCKDGILPIYCAVPCLHGDFGEDGVIQGALTAAHIPFVGQDVYAAAMTSDKVYTKLAAESLGIKCPRWIICTRKNTLQAKMAAEEKLGYPMFIKPARLGSSYGAHPVRCESEFDDAYNDAKKHESRILIEELIDYEYELECSLFDAGERKINPSGRILSNGSFYSFSAKYEGVNSPKTEICAVEDRISLLVREYTDKLCCLIGIRGLSRLDYFVTKSGEVYFNEVNSFPGMTDTSLYPRLVDNKNFINLLIERAATHDWNI